MLLATKCPYCLTTFRVVNDQLKLHAGVVRCGCCQKTFNGIEHLAGATPVIPASVSPIPQANPTPTPAISLIEPDKTFTASEAAPFSSDEAVIPAPEKSDTTDTAYGSDLDFYFPDYPDPLAPAPASTPIADTHSDSPVPATGPLQTGERIEPHFQFDHANQALNTTENNADFFAATPLHALHAPAGNMHTSKEAAVFTNNPDTIWAVPDSVGQDSDIDDAKENDAASFFSKARQRVSGDDLHPDADSSADDLNDEPRFISAAKSRKRINRLLLISSLFLLLALAIQTTYLLRNQIAAMYPASKTALGLFCDYAQCSITLPAQPDALSYEADELHSLPRENTFEFSLLLHNRSTLPQTWPHIELTLVNAQKQPIVRRVFGPRDYLGTPQDITSGFAPNQEQAVKLYFELSKVKASDYLVGIFYP